MAASVAKEMQHAPDVSSQGRTGMTNPVKTGALFN